MRRRSNTNEFEDDNADEWARRLQLGSEVLLQTLFRYLSKLPEEDTIEPATKCGGMTLPASAVGWLSGQLYPLDDEDEDDFTTTTIAADPLWMGVALRDRLSLLRFLLPRVTHLRLTRDVWPPPIHKTTSRHHPNNNVIIQQARAAGPPEELNCSTISVSSALTTDTLHVPPTRQAFLRYMKKLIHHPRIDLRVFPSLQALVLEGIPPTWISHLYSLQDSLQVLRVNKACLYHLPSLLFPPPLSETQQQQQQQQQQSPADTFSPLRMRRKRQQDDPLAPISTTDTRKPIQYPYLSHCRLDHCGVGELSELPRSLRKLQNVQSLSLAHNDICTETTALKGLRHLSLLNKLNLSFNSITALPNAYRHLGQIQVLQLSHNQITTAKGLDRLYGLEELYLDHNAIQNIHELAGLARLPLLRKLYLRGNPLLDYRVPLLAMFQQHRRCSTKEELPILDNLPVTNSKEWLAIRDESFENAVDFVRVVNHDHDVVESSITTLTPVFVSPKRNRRVHRTQLKAHKVKIQNSSIPRQRTLQQKVPTEGGNVSCPVSNTSKQKKKKKRKLSKPCCPEPEEQEKPNEEGQSSAIVSSNATRIVAFSVRDVLWSMKEPEEDSLPASLTGDKTDPTEEEEEECPVSTVPDTFTSSTKEEPGHVPQISDSKKPEQQSSSSSSKEGPPKKYPQASAAADLLETTTLDLKVKDGAESKVHEEEEVQVENGDSISNHRDTTYEGIVSSETVINERPSIDELKGAGNIESVETKTETNNENKVNIEDRPKDVPYDTTTENTVNGELVAGTLTLDCDPLSPKTKDGLNKSSTTKNTERRKPKVGSVKLQTGTTRQFDVFGADWDELVRQAAEGLIPNGKIRTPVADLEELDKKKGDVFSMEAVGLLSPTAADLTTTVETPTQEPSVATIDESQLSERGGGYLPSRLLLQDDFSVPSSLGTNREDFPPLSKFQLAEDNLEYDGPEACRNMNVLKNMQLYFNTFVFPSSVSKVPRSLSKKDATGGEDWLEVAVKYPRVQLWPEDRRLLEIISEENGDSISNRERCIRIWEEDVIPCGKPALRRLAPNRRMRLSFHGDHLYENAAPDPYIECRKVFLCLSSVAFYVTLANDVVTSSQEGKNKKFPVPISEEAKFGDAPWPHAVARHTFQELQAITIGFDFQRITLRFSNPSIRKTDPFVYVLLTSNKTETVGLLQEIQHLAKEANEYVTDLVSDATAVAIENDSQVVFDALAVAVAPDLVGTVLQYQIVQQQWKHGGRGTVRRVCVVTDTKIFLLDEDYTSDGHQPLGSSTNGEHLADVSYRIVDEATLRQVSEVQAAGADPKAITIVINPLSRLSRTHRWRLLCRDSAGAERLVEGVRKALALDED